MFTNGLMTDKCTNLATERYMEEWGDERIERMEQMEECRNKRVDGCTEELTRRQKVAKFFIQIAHFFSK